MTLNPFPGLRPFQMGEEHLFFGREGHSEEILRRLRQNRFLAVVGTSGSGKSSLVRAGLLPHLHGGFMSGAGSHWQVAMFRPESDPIGNMARALSDPALAGTPTDNPEEAAKNTFLLEITLRRSGLGLVEAVRLARLPEHENVLIVVDQFEELFRFAAAASAAHKQEDASAFVKLLLEATQQREIPIYVVITMRSDFIGDCARFRDLPEAVTAGLYLIPRMTREQRRLAIEGPAQVSQAEISRRLVNRLLNDVGDDPDELPILQHALMRTWDCWHANGREGQPIDLDDYSRIGGLAEALSRHADEAYNSLPDERHRTIAKKIFQSLTEKGPDNREVRRPTSVANIAAAANVEVAEVISVIDCFRQPGRSFLMPPANVPLKADSVIDIAHESLIRLWGKLKEWVEEESRSALEYRRLAETAMRYAQGKSDLLRDPELSIALKWRNQQNPNAAWASQYHPGFSEVMAFLAESEKDRDHELALMEHQRQRALRRTKMTLGLVFTALVLVAGLTVYAMASRRKAINETAEVEKQKIEVENQKTKAEEQTAQVEKQKVVLEQQKGVLEFQKTELEKKEAEKERQREKALEEEQIAKKALAKADATQENLKQTRDMLQKDVIDQMIDIGNLDSSTQDLPDVQSLHEKFMNGGKRVLEKILKEDPNNREAMTYHVVSMAYHADLLRRRKIYEKAKQECDIDEQEAEKLGEKGKNNLSRTLSAILFALSGTTRMGLREQEKAISDSNKAVRIGATVATEPNSTDDPNWRLLGVAYSSAGDIQKNYGYPKDALEDYQKALKALNKAPSQVNDSTLLSDMKQLAQLQVELDHSEEAVATYSDAIQLATRWTESSSANPKLIDDLFWLYLGKGDLLLKRGDRRTDSGAYQNSAEAMFGLANSTAERLDATTSSGQYDRAAADERMGNLWRARKDFQRALDFHLKAKEQFRRLAATARNAHWTRTAGIGENQVGQDYYLLKDFDNARQHYKAAVEAYELAEQLEPSDQATRDTVNAYGTLVNLEQEAGKEAMSRAYLDEQIKKLTVLVDSSRPQVSDKKLMANALGNRSWKDIVLGDFEKAISDAKKGLSYNDKATWIHGNEAHGYLFSGKFETARQIYVENADKPAFPDNPTSDTFLEATLKDFQELRKHPAPGMDLKAMEQMEKELLKKTKPAAQESSTSGNSSTSRQ
ncbi:MAG TPA: hypothetical protein VHA33_06290 [Candidatus Angelobacter sp.]|jgi:energy-coupling factor transporter ATP-binding protein EcfA2|nr:hypothetical protein [Candidatus Angelobacter sp.]